MKYGDFFNGKKVILFNIDSTIRESKARRRFTVEPEDIDLRMNARRRLVKLKHLGYTLVGISIQPGLNESYQYKKDLFEDGFFSTQKKLGTGRMDKIIHCSECKTDSFSDSIIAEINKLNSDEILYVTEDGRDWNLAKILGLDSIWSTAFFAKVDDIRII